MKALFVLHFLSTLPKPQKAYPVLLESWKINEKLKEHILFFCNKNHSSSFEPVLLMCCSLCSSGISMWHRMKQTDGADQRFSSFFLRTEEAWKKLEQMVESLMYWFHVHLHILRYMYQAQLSGRGNAITYLKLSIFKPTFWKNIPQRETEHTADAL